MPAFLRDEPHTLADLKNLRQEIKNADEKEQKKILKKQIYESPNSKNGGFKASEPANGH
jgi:hypothetical protein